MKQCNVRQLAVFTNVTRALDCVKVVQARRDREQECLGRQSAIDSEGGLAAEFWRPSPAHLLLVGGVRLAGRSYLASCQCWLQGSIELHRLSLGSTKLYAGRNKRVQKKIFANQTSPTPMFGT